MSVIQPDVMYHLAAQSYPKIAWEQPQFTMITNLVGTINLLEALRKQNKPAKFIAAGSSAEYAPRPDGMPIKETDRLKPTNLYGASKLAMSETVRLYAERYGLQTIVIRPFFIIGPRKTGDFCSDIAISIVDIEQGKKQKLSVGNLKIIRDFLDVRDAVDAMMLLIEKGQKGEVYNICSGSGYVLQDIITKYKKISTANIEEESNPLLIRPGDEMIKIGDPGKLKKLGWSPRYNIDDSLHNILDFWRSNKV